MKRIEVLDLWRSLCILLMIFCHGVYDLGQIGVIEKQVYNSEIMWLLSRVCAGSFILLSGICTRFSRSAVKRGFFLFGCAIAVSAVTMAAGKPIYFGVLHLLGISMMLCGAARSRLDTVPVKKLVTICMLLAVVSALAVRFVPTNTDWLFPLGFRSVNFYSADYYPLFPWFFVFTAGAALGRMVEKKRFGRLFSVHVHPVLTFAGRHSLLLYLIHQPILYAIFQQLF